MKKQNTGNLLEPHAIQKFISENKRLHKSFNVSESGFVLALSDQAQVQTDKSKIYT